MDLGNFSDLELSLFSLLLEQQLVPSCTAIAAESYNVEAFLNAYIKVFKTISGTQANETLEITLSLVMSSRLI